MTDGLIVKSDKAKEGAKNILDIVEAIRRTMDELDNAVKNNIPNKVETQWSDTLRSNWQNYYTGDIPEVMAGMRTSATNIQTAVRAAEAYSNME